LDDSGGILGDFVEFEGGFGPNNGSLGYLPGEPNKGVEPCAPKGAQGSAFWCRPPAARPAATN